MDALKLKRKSLRTSFTTAVKAIDEETAKDDPNSDKLCALNSQLTDKFTRLNEIQGQISDLLLEGKVDEKEYTCDFEAAEKYRDNYLTAKGKIESKLVPAPVLSESNAQNEASGKRKFKLPRLELKQFSGEVKDWLGFWSQFSKINEDADIADEDKFQYLIQAMKPGSRAASLIESFPPTTKNYPLAVEQLKDRFGRDDLLVQIYVRELLNMVMKNAADRRMKTDLTSLYDQIESHLRALETLGRTQEKFADFLAPLVESCLPEDILRAWERSRSADSTEAGSSERSLKKLMLFLKQEVNGDEMINLARSGFGGHKEAYRRSSPKNSVNEISEVATATSLTNRSNREDSQIRKIFNCVFCDKSHASSECFSARKMSTDDRKRLLQKKGACFTCLKLGHMSRSCKFKPNCMKCGRRHYTLMCNDESEVSNVKPSSEKEFLSSSALSNQHRTETVLLQTLLVNIHAGGKKEIIRAIIDTGSQRSYITDKIARSMKLKAIRHEKVVHGLFGQIETLPQDHAVHVIYLSDLKTEFRCHFEVLNQPKICGGVPRLGDEDVIKTLKRKSINLADLPGISDDIDLLIGADIAGKLMTGNVVQIDFGLVAVKTKLGWTLLGKQNKTMGEDNVLTALSLHVADASITQLWELDSLGIADPETKLARDESYSQAMLHFEDTLEVLPEGRYQVQLPWKFDCTELPSNRDIALQRIKNVCTREKARGNLVSYQAVFKEWQELNIIEEVPHNEIESHGHYLPHRPVIKQHSETTKIRPVFDASAKKKGGISLNDCLEKGINLIELVPDIIDRFRRFSIGLTADIEKAFLQILIAPHHRDFLRFFFPTEEEERVFRHCRVTFGVSSSPFLLGAVISHLLTNVSDEFRTTAQKLQRCFYVDDCVTGVSDQLEMEHFILEAQDIMAQGCFNLRGWQSNKESVYTLENRGDVKVLGMLWNLERDTLRCNFTFLNSEIDYKLSKRRILSIAQRLFDPIGILTPTTLIPKLLLQETWQLKISWDVPLPDALQKTFLSWLKELTDSSKIELQRFTGANESSELHIFVDASKKAYSACAFLRSDTDNGIVIRLLRSKARIAPIKTLTIPRLELMACCIGARLAHSIREALELPDIAATYWSDSMVALWWIREKGNWSPFVANRVREIHTLSSQESWRHVPGVKNPADLLSRGCSPKQLLISQWWNGPPWLAEPPDIWPAEEIVCQTAEVDIEKRKTSTCIIDLCGENSEWYAKSFSNFHSMIRLVSWIKRFVNNCRKTKDERKCGELSFEETDQSEKTLIRIIQSHAFPKIEEISIINAFVDEEGILRVKTRITERLDQTSFLSPILLPGNCTFTNRLVECIHLEKCHAGPQILLNILRERYWIIRARKTVRSVLNSCMKCRRYRAKEIATEPVCLPADRVNDAAIFEIVGVDLAGPLYLKKGDKSWIVLFTCALYRAVHLELVKSLSTDSFILSLRRFIARRGRPRIIYSDNGTNFKGAYAELINIDWNSVLQYSTTQRIIWRFNPPTAAWWGGWWERLVRVVKELLRRTLGKATLNYEELLTVLCDIESVVNSRPLTYLVEGSEDLVPLTPAMFLLDKRSSDVPDIDFADSQHFAKRIRYRAKLLQDLRQRFRKEYLGKLVEKRSIVTSARELSKGEVVLIGDDFRKRIHWPLARVVDLIPGKDGVIRTVRLKTKNGILLRPVQRIFPLEMKPISANEQPQFEKGDVDVKTMEEKEDQPSQVIKEKVTRSGRVVKVPQKLDLFNQVSYIFESEQFAANSKRREDVTASLADVPKEERY